MPGMERELGKNERVVKMAEVRMALVIPYVLIGALLCFTGRIGGTIGVLLAAVTYLAFHGQKLMLTDRRLVGKLGIIRIISMDAPLNKINMVSVEKSLYARILGYGHLKITTAAGDYDYKFIKNADEFRAAVMEAIDRYERNGRSGER